MLKNWPVGTRTSSSSRSLPSGYPDPTAQWRSTELVAQSLAGVVYRSGVPELPPVSAPGSYSEDFGAAVGALAGVLALWNARHQGGGQLIDLSAISALAHATDMSLPLWSQLKMPAARMRRRALPAFRVLGRSGAAGASDVAG